MALAKVLFIHAKVTFQGNDILIAKCTDQMIRTVTNKHTIMR